MKGAWLLPTRRRLPVLERFLKAAIEMQASTPGLIIVQEDEWKELRSAYEALALPAGWSFRQTKADGVGDKFREVWASVQNHDWIGWVVDDVVPETPHWDTKLVGLLDGQNVVSCNDGARAPQRMCAPVFSGDLARAVGYLYAPGFWHAYMDDAWERLGRATDTWFVCMDVVLRHIDAFQTGVADDTHVRSYHRMAEDERAMYAWRKTEMDNAVMRVMRMKAEKRSEREKERKVANA